MQRTAPTSAIAADSFHLKPLLRTLQSSSDYCVLSISRNSAELYRGNRYALKGRGTTLLVEAERHIPARLDAATGAVQSQELANPDTDDLLNDVAVLVMKNGSEVLVLPTKRMPASTGAAAIYRY